MSQLTRKLETMSAEDTEARARLDALSKAKVCGISHLDILKRKFMIGVVSSYRTAIANTAIVHRQGIPTG